MVIQSRTDVAEHDCAGKRRSDGAKSKISLGVCQLFFMALFEARFEPVGEVRGRLYWGKVSEKQQRSADLCILLCAVLAFSYVSLHANQLDTRQRIVYKS